MNVFGPFTPYIEVAIIALLVYYLLSFFWNTRSMDVVVGFCAFLLILAISSWLNLPVLHKVLMLGVNTIVIAILIIFQPELRLFLSKLRWKNRRLREISAIDQFLDGLSQAVYRMADKKIGALVAIELEDSLQEFTEKGISLGAKFSPELLETIFSPNTPLHDGAVIIRGESLLAAAVILPLADDTGQVAKSMGTRHRAALGLSLQTDAVVVVISEESGRVSIVREGVMTRGVKPERFKISLRPFFSAQEKKSRGWFPLGERA